MQSQNQRTTVYAYAGRALAEPMRAFEEGGKKGAVRILEEFR
jgi:hypothetical protein